MKTLATLFWAFFKIGAFTFGGGYAMIPMIQKEAVDKYGWVSDSDILEIVAIAESTPGPIAINAATFVGYRRAGFLGALAATLGVVLPSFAVIFVLSGVLSRFQDLPAVRYAFFGIRAGVLALIIKAMIGMYRKCEKRIFAWCIMIGVFVAVGILKISALPVLLVCAVTGLCLSRCRKEGAK